jgi:hypothetical protein
MKRIFSERKKEKAMNAVIVEYAGLTHQAANLIESFRESPSETTCDIIVRVLGKLRAPVKTRSAGSLGLDLGQGAFLEEGETILLFLSEKAKKDGRPDAEAEVRHGALFLFGKKVKPSKGSLLQPAMTQVLKKQNRRNEKGEIISLNAWRQWYVVRNNQLIATGELRDQALTRKRGRTFVTNKPAAELGF